MSKQILDFCKFYKKKLEIKKKNEKTRMEAEVMKDKKAKALMISLAGNENVTFSIHVKEHLFSQSEITPYTGVILFELDEDDLKYLYDKYSKRLQGEMEDNIHEIKSNYNI